MLLVLINKKSVDEESVASKTSMFVNRTEEVKTRGKKGLVSSESIIKTKKQWTIPLKMDLPS